MKSSIYALFLIVDAMAMARSLVTKRGGCMSTGTVRPQYECCYWDGSYIGCVVSAPRFCRWDPVGDRCVDTRTYCC
ncbi:unnamed protein product [Zymoseptoria tritici ST99CH_3D7]|uniref:Uncharacterized protein n=1 Tax=Zymoseptoria tritici (strain ST99CH_3D7) TaxID=1276538 RepID=A0A1X7RZ43_ZYMT9|nr:unnamed protein product [Zymoseptoria tritici ST99CH_3D7]